MLVFTAADGNYALQAQVWFRSLTKTQTSDVRVVVFGNGWNQRDKDLMISFASSSFSVEFREVDTTRFSGVKLKNRFPLATAYNVLAPKYFFPNEQRAIYMDADTIVTEDLRALWETDLQTAVGAVLDAHIVWAASPSMWRPWREEGLEPFTPYLNTGMMLMDLARWRDEKITERTLGFLEKYELPCVDQDALNLVLRGNFDQLHPRYNSMPFHHLKMLRYLDTVESDEKIGEAIMNPAIIHFHRSFLGKPWTYGCSHPGTKLWRHLAHEVNPDWSKQFELINSARSVVAGFAGMKQVDKRSIEYPLEMLDQDSTT